MIIVPSVLDILQALAGKMTSPPAGKHLCELQRDGCWPNTEP